MNIYTNNLYKKNIFVKKILSFTNNKYVYYSS